MLFSSLLRCLDFLFSFSDQISSAPPTATPTTFIRCRQHILPEVSQTCQRVVIINKGRVVAVDTPENLTAQLRGSSGLYVQVDVAGADAAATLARVPGVSKVTAVDRHETAVGYEIDVTGERDVRRDVSREIVGSGWGLLELRPMRISLEDIFLQLTTDETKQEPVEPVEPMERVEPVEPEGSPNA